MQDVIATPATFGATMPPDGAYDGIWGAYRVTVMHEGKQCLMNTNIGIRCPAAPCIMTVTNGKATVKVREPEYTEPQ